MTNSTERGPLKFLYTILLISIFLTTWPQTSVRAETTTETSAKKSQIDDLFLWKVSDQLKLSLKKEKDLADLLKKYSSLKIKINEQIEDTIEALGKKNDDKNYALRLKEYRRFLKNFNDLSLKELDDLQKLLGTKDLAQYLVIKQEFANKVKNILLQEKAK